MCTEDLIRAWKDPAFRERCDGDEFPSHPAGSIELSDRDLALVSGGGGGQCQVATEEYLTMGCCDGLTSSDGFCTFACPVDGPSLTPCGSGCCPERMLMCAV